MRAHEPFALGVAIMVAPGVALLARARGLLHMLAFLVASSLFAGTPDTSDPKLKAKALDTGADAAAEAGAQADELSAAGKEQFAQRRYSDAIATFRKAEALRPKAANIYNIGKCYERLAEFGLALRHYREYLRIEADADKDASVQTDITNAEARLREEGRQQLVVFTEPSSARVSVDGQPVYGAPAYVELPAGPHRLTVTADGYATANLRLELSADRIAETTVVLRPAAGGPDGPRREDTAELVLASDAGRAVTFRSSAEVNAARASIQAKKVTAVALGGLGAALLMTGVVSGALALHHHQTAVDLQHGPSESDFNAAKSAAVREMVLSNVAYGAGAVALGVGLILAINSGLFGGPAEPRLAVAPLGGGGLLVLSGGL
jgi:tetratricopeptide (TPR) repeat protein